MIRAQTILVAVGVVIAALVAESYLGWTRYKLNGATYAVPHKYEFFHNFSVSWLTGLRGGDKEPDESVWLLFPASELAQGVRGYSRWFHGYASEVAADIVVNVLGGKEAREFPSDRAADLRKVAQELSKSDLHPLDRTTGWDRVYWSVGEKGTPGEGHNLFYLMPKNGLEHLPAGWRVPYCQSSPDIANRETYYCNLTLYRDGLTYTFYMREENLRIANRIPEYVESRMKAWRAQSLIR